MKNFLKLITKEKNEKNEKKDKKYNGWSSAGLSPADLKAIKELQSAGGHVVGSRMLLHCLVNSRGCPASIKKWASSYFEGERDIDVDILFPSKGVAAAAAALLREIEGKGVKIKEYYGKPKKCRTPYGMVEYCESREVLKTPTATIDILGGTEMSLRDQWKSWCERHPEAFEEFSMLLWKNKIKTGEEWPLPF